MRSMTSNSVQDKMVLWVRAETPGSRLGVGATLSPETALLPPSGRVAPRP